MECAERVAFYFSYPHVAKLEEVATNNLVFPAVTICNLNEFRFSKLTVNDLYHAGELLGLLNVHLEIQSPQLADPIVLKALKKKADFTHYKPRIFNMREFYDRVGHSLKDMMLYCKFRGVRCTHKDFKTLCTAKICSLRFDFLWYDVVTKHHNLHLVMKLELALEWLKSMKKFNR
ncbi:hypothetical protein scyTo_0013166 [Scyliorhinus torazame]|uniref:Uncharacterized protein n=2 Tax=Scyliorhinus torazame TaxID=75743 RepID=A0A401NQS8_SCYTO|nr:hypothetical protein [Scyliorhinus torazame]